MIRVGAEGVSTTEGFLVDETRVGRGRFSLRWTSSLDGSGVGAMRARGCVNCGREVVRLSFLCTGVCVVTLVLAVAFIGFLEVDVALALAAAAAAALHVFGVWGACFPIYVVAWVLGLLGDGLLRIEVCRFPIVVLAVTSFVFALDSAP